MCIQYRIRTLKVHGHIIAWNERIHIDHRTQINWESGAFSKNMKTYSHWIDQKQTNISTVQALLAKINGLYPVSVMLTTYADEPRLSSIVHGICPSSPERQQRIVQIAKW